MGSYIFVVLLSLFLSQLIKFIYRNISKTQENKNLLWVFVWATGAPSAHASVLTSYLVLLHRDIGNDPVFGFQCLIAVIFMYNLVADREREKIRGTSGKTLDISGHTFFDIVSGVILGFIVGILYINF